MPVLKLLLLGSPQIELDGQAIQIERRKALALLAYLAVTGETFAREALATLLWPEQDTARALAYLRRTLWEVNQAVGKGWIELEQEKVRLETSHGLWLDTAQFTALLAPCRAADAPPSCQDALAEAAALYRGDFLAGFQVQDSAEFEEWQFLQAERLRGDLAFALHHLAAGHEAQAAYAQALPYAQRWLALDNLEEAAHRQLMRLHAQSGQRAAAIRQYALCKATLHDELGLAPSPETVALYEQIRRSELGSPRVPGISAASPAPTAPPTALLRRVLPAPPTPFVGRDSELAEIEGLMASNGHRLLTLMGPGGSGKTRLAIASAARLADHHTDLCADGVYFVPLAPLLTSDALVPAVAAALQFGFYTEGGEPHQQLLNYLREKRMLVILDNYEHLVDEIGLRLPVDILATAPGVRLLVTSRTRLNIQGEQLYAMTGMRTPEPAAVELWIDPLAEAGSYSALRLFIQSARRVQPSFTLTASNLADVARICKLVDGMPLGIELAASWLEVLAPAEVRAEIEKSLDFLETSLLDMPARQRSIRAVFDASWAMLTAAERDTLQRLAVFRGSFSRAAAEQVASASLRTLLTLSNKSWLQRHSDDRYHVHELLRQYAHAQLENDPTTWVQARSAHAAYYADFVAAQEKQMASPQRRVATSVMQQEFDNVVVAWQWLVDRGQFDVLTQSMLGGVVRHAVVFQRGDQSWSMMKRARQALEARANTPQSQLDLAILLTAEALLGLVIWVTPAVAGWVSATPRVIIRQAWDIVCRLPALPPTVWTVLLGDLVAGHIDFAEGHQALGELLPVLRTGDDRWLLAFALRIYARQITVRAADHAAALQLLAEALTIQQQIGDDLEQATILADLANLAMETQAYTEAADLWRAARDTFVRVGDMANAGYMTWRLGDVSIEHGHFGEAFDLFHEAQHIFRQSGFRGQEIDCVHNESILALRYGTIEHARRTRQYCLEVNEQLGLALSVAWSKWELGDIERVDGHVERARALYQEAYRGFLTHDVPFGIAYYHRGLGELALATGDFAEAQAQIHMSLDNLRTAHNRWTTAYVLSLAGRAAVGLADYAAAARTLAEALDTTVRLGQHGLMMVPLAAVAQLWAATGNTEAAIRLAAFVAQHWATWHETRRYAITTRTQVAAMLPAPVVEAAVREGEALDMAGALALAGVEGQGLGIGGWGLGVGDEERWIGFRHESDGA